MHVLVCGDRAWGVCHFPHTLYPQRRCRPDQDCPAKIDLETMHERLQRLPLDKNLVIIEGEAYGADKMARNWAIAHHISYVPYPAQWQKYGRAAGPVRNKQMLDEGKPDLVLAFHHDIDKSKGTKDMVAIARKAGIPVEVIG